MSSRESCIGQLYRKLTCEKAIWGCRQPRDACCSFRVAELGEWLVDRLDSSEGSQVKADAGREIGSAAAGSCIVARRWRPRLPRHTRRGPSRRGIGVAHVPHKHSEVTTHLSNGGDNARVMSEQRSGGRQSRILAPHLVQPCGEVLCVYLIPRDGEAHALKAWHKLTECSC